MAVFPSPTDDLLIGLGQGIIGPYVDGSGGKKAHTVADEIRFDRRRIFDLDINCRSRGKAGRAGQHRVSIVNNIISADGNKEIFLGLFIQLVEEAQTAFVCHVRTIDVAVKTQNVERLGVDQGDQLGLVPRADMGQANAEPLPEFVDLLVLVPRMGESLLMLCNLSINGFLQRPEIFRFEKFRNNLHGHIQGAHVRNPLQARNLTGGVVAVSRVRVPVGWGTKPQLIVIPQTAFGNIRDIGYLANCQVVIFHSKGPFRLSILL